MPLVRDSVAGIRAHLDRGRLFDMLAEQFRFQVGHHPSPAERRSWESSLPVLVNDLQQAGLDDVEMLVEYQLPLSSKRADVVVCGVSPRTRQDSYVVIELKQWSQAHLLDETNDVVEIDGRDRPHPIVQVSGYCDHMQDFLATLTAEPMQLAGAAYLHNATDRDVSELWSLPESDKGRLFTGQRRGAFIEYLKSKLSAEPGAAAADRLLSSAVRPSKQLMALAADEVQRREQFVLLDEQEVAYSLVIRALDRAYAANTKEVVIITGGPGSGKSVIALSLLGELSRRGRTALHATGSSAFTMTLRRVAGNRAPRVRQMFRYYNQFVDAERNELDVLICDEAHRIKETSTNRFTPARNRTGRPQVEELIDAARVPVFLLDEHQVVRPSERGTVADIRTAAARLGCSVRQIDLDGQFRCGGSRVYEHWVLRLLGLEPGGPIPWTGDANFILDVAEAPSLMEMRLERLLDQGYSARMSAGYCWPWSDPARDGRLVPDVVIGDWRRPWNNKKDTSHGGAPGTPYWATDPAGFGQIGCVYTAQGFEYDYSGVIIGPDLVWRTDHWEAQPQRSHDNQVRRGDVTSFDRAVRNTYKVLLTRGMRGTTVMSTDSETQAMLESLVP